MSVDNQSVTEEAKAALVTWKHVFQLGMAVSKFPLRKSYVKESMLRQGPNEGIERVFVLLAADIHITCKQVFRQMALLE